MTGSLPSYLSYPRVNWKIFLAKMTTKDNVTISCNHLLAERSILVSQMLGSYCKCWVLFFLNFVFYFIWRIITSKMLNSISGETVKPFLYDKTILYIAVTYILLCELHHDYHNQGWEMLHWQWEKYDLPCDTKISKCLKKKSWKDRTGLL